MRLGRSRFAKVVAAQLDVFEHDHCDVIAAAGERLASYNRAGRAEAEELYGDYVDAVETGTDILADMRDHYALTVDDADAYVREFNRAVAKRLPEFSREIESS